MIGMGDSDEKWYYCLKHHRAEQGKRCWFADRMGPYPDRATAERALEIVRERNAREDARDGRD
ncbi:hypothetical protein B7C42_03429 [Nocardia cerradoensis]|uniref:Uncharacterized protein n=2 Tax=Nocardia cerradoensis TaxID=85688 RepID=A0A231H713_9NOCA|nr:hypothetical protein B7C42_03429 [Nocardia cerradoensis]